MLSLKGAISQVPVKKSNYIHALEELYRPNKKK